MTESAENNKLMFILVPSITIPLALSLTQLWLFPCSDRECREQQADVHPGPQHHHPSSPCHPPRHRLLLPAPGPRSGSPPERQWQECPARGNEPAEPQTQQPCQRDLRPEDPLPAGAGGGCFWKSEWWSFLWCVM